VRLPLIAFALTLLGAEEPTSSAPLRVHGQTVVVLATGDGMAGPAERARAAEAIVEQILTETNPDTSVSVEPVASDAGLTDFYTLRTDGKDILRLGPDDARSSGLAPALFARETASSLEMALAGEKRHLSQQRLLQAIAMTVFLGLLTFLALRWVSDAGKRARVLLEQWLARVRGLRIREVEVVSAETLEGTSYALVGIARTALQLGILYAYVAFALSQFVATRSAVGPMTHALTAPFASLLGHVVGWLPVALLFVAAVYFLRGAFHLTGFLLDRVARGEFQWRWLPRELATPTRPLVRAALLVGVALLFGPLAGAGSDALLTRLGLLALGVVSLALVPAAAAAALGTLAIFGRRYRVGEWVAIGDNLGEVIEVGFLDVTLVPVDAGRIRLSHLVLLWTAVRHLPGPPSVEVELPADLAADPEQVMHVLAEAFEPTRRPEVTLREVTTAAALYQLRFPAGVRVAGALPIAFAALSKAGFTAVRRS
jgi:hypothetical protein